ILLRFSAWDIKTQRRHRGATFFDRPMLSLIFFDVFLKGQHKTFGMWRTQYDPAFHLCLGHIWHHPDEVYYKLLIRMRDDRKVSIDSVCYFFRNLNIHLFLFFFHDIFILTSKIGYLLRLYQMIDRYY